MQATVSGTAVPIVIARDTYDVPADFVSLINRTQWDRTNHWELIGPLSPQQDQWVRSGIVATGPRIRWRQVGRVPGIFRLWPPPTSSTAPSTLSYEYLSNYWANSGTGLGEPKASFTADSDTCVYDDRVMIDGIKYMFFQQKGMEYTKLEANFNESLQVSMARDGGAATLTMARRRIPIFISPANIQDGYFPGP